MRQKLKLVYKCLFIGKRKKKPFMLICCKTPTGRGQQQNHFKRPLKPLWCDVRNKALRCNTVNPWPNTATEACKMPVNAVPDRSFAFNSK